MTDLTPNDLSHLSDDEFAALCPQGEHAPGAILLSPVAFAIYEAFNQDRAYLLADFSDRLAAVLRAVAEGLGESRAPGLEPEELYGRIIDVDDLLNIAKELESIQ